MFHEYCKECNIEYSTSVWDMNAANQIISMNPKMIKIPSACNLNFALIDHLYQNYTGEIHISLGMATQEERYNILNHLSEQDPKQNRTTVYWTTSGYPVKFEELYLMEIEKLVDNYNFRIGYSGHNLGIAADIAAFTLGATCIERHFTLDRTWKGTDQAASLEPQGLSKLHRDLTAVSQALQHKTIDMTEDEKRNRSKLRTTDVYEDDK